MKFPVTISRGRDSSFPEKTEDAIFKASSPEMRMIPIALFMGAVAIAAIVSAISLTSRVV